MIYFVKIGLVEVKDVFFLALGNAMTVLQLYDGFGPRLPLYQAGPGTI